VDDQDVATAAAALLPETGPSPRQPVQLVKPRIVVGRDRTACDVVLAHPFISKSHAALETDQSGRTTVRDLGSKFGTFVNGKQVVDGRALTDGDRVAFGPEGLIVFRYAVDRRAGRTDLTAREPEAGALDGATTLRVLNVSVLNIGRAPDNEIVVDGPGVSRHHAKLTLTGERPSLADCGSTNGTYVNGELIREPRPLEPDDLIFLGGFLFKVHGRTIKQLDLSASRICAFGLSKQIKGEPVMSDVSLAVFPGEFVGLMGPSGCGKSTLMDALDGLQPAPVGSVFLGDLDLYRNFNAVRRSIGHVPQHDILHDDVSVHRTLRYAARLRLPETTTRRSLEAVVASVVDVVNLRHKLKTPFRNLSGGEQKRLSIAIELITRPNFLFLDEPTSPLDPETTEDLMDRFRRLADEGRIVVMITHKFEKFETMDQVAILAKGGRLAFFGPPRAALAYFGCREPAEIFRRLHDADPDELARRFLASEQHRRYVRSRLAESRALMRDPGTAGTAAQPVKSSFRAQLAQWWTLTQRFSEIKLKDRRNTALLLLQSPIIALILVLISGNAKNDAKTLFISAVIAVWFGANNAIREIVAEFPIYRRERRFSLRIPPYVLSKFTVLSAIGLVQSSLFLAILTAFHLFEARDFGLLWAVLYLTTVGGISMALLFSALVNSAEKALSILPLLLIPQLLLSGFLKPVEPIYLDRTVGKPISAAAYDARLANTPAGAPQQVEKRDGLGAGNLVSGLVLARWSLDGLAHAVSLRDASARGQLAATLSVAAYGSVLDGDDDAAVRGAYRARIALDLFALLAFSLVFLPLTMWALRRRDVL
jgi:ABC transport system ATP-binding/permease protein